jgi:hypothetical protein
MKNARIILARYKAGRMTREQVLSYIESAMNAKMDEKAIRWILKQL